MMMLASSDAKDDAVARAAAAATSPPHASTHIAEVDVDVDVDADVAPAVRDVIFVMPALPVAICMYSSAALLSIARRNGKGR